MRQPNIFKKLPKKVRVHKRNGVFLYPIKHKRLLISEKFIEHGYIEKDEQIVINKSLDRTDQESALIHEIIHALDWSLSEKKVLLLEQKIVELFRKNKWKIVF